MCEHCRSIQTWRKFDAPKDYLACIAYIQQLVSEGEFELMQEESTCPLEKVKTEDGWADEIKVFDMDIIGCDPGVTEQEVAKYGIHLLPQEKVLQDSDFLSLHAPLNRYTKHMINRETLSQMKPGAILINTARGPLVDEQALREAVLSGHLAGAALDVLNEEPVRPDAPLLGQEQIILTPHCAWYSETAMHTLLKSAAEEVVRALRGEPLFHPVSHN